MAYFGDIQDTIVRDKVQAFMNAVADLIGDNDEAVDARDRTPDKLEYQDGFEFVAPVYLSFYWSSGTGTPMHDKMIERLIASQAEEWARQYPHRAPMLDILAGDESEFRDEAEQWEMAALDDEYIYIRVEMTRKDGDIEFRSCFMNEINIPYGDEFVTEMTETDFLTLDSEGLEEFGKRIADAPYKATLD